MVSQIKNPEPHGLRDDPISGEDRVEFGEDRSHALQRALLEQDSAPNRWLTTVPDNIVRPRQHAVGGHGDCPGPSNVRNGKTMPRLLEILSHLA
jgi:hypothetical protein